MAEDVSQKPPVVGDNNKLSKSTSRTSSDLFCICGDSEKNSVQPAPPHSSGNNQKKKTSFQITSVTVGSRLSNDGGDDSADDLDESHTDDMSDVIDTSRVTDVENETPSFSEDTFSKEDVFFNSSTSLGSAPVIPTSSQYGLAIVSAPDICNNSNSSAQCGAISNSDLHVTVADSVLNLSVLGAKQHEADMRDIHNHPGRNERFKVVKIESTEPFKRGRWVCMDFLDHSIVQSKPNSSSKQCEPSDNQSAPHAGTDSGIFVADSNLVNEDVTTADNVNSINNHVQNEQITAASSGLSQSVPGQTQTVPGSNHNISGQNHNVSAPTQSAPATHSNASPGQTQQFNPVNCSQPQQHAQSMSQIPVQQTTNFINTNQHQSLQAQQLQQVLANANYQVHSNATNNSQQQQHMNVNNVMQQTMPMQQHVQQQFQQPMPPQQVVQPNQVHNVSQQQFQQPQQQQPQQVQMMQQIPVSQQQPAFVQQCAPVVGSQPSVVAQQPQPIPQQAQQYYTNPTVVHSSNALTNQVPIINSQNQNLTNMMPVHQPQVVNTSQPQQILTQQSQPQVISQPNSMQGQQQQTVPIISQPPNSIPAQPQTITQTNLIQSQPVISQQSASQPLMNQQQNPIQTQPQQQLISQQQSSVVQSQPQHMLAQQSTQPSQPQQMMGQQTNSQSAQPSSMLSMQSQPQQMMQQQAPIQTQQVILQQPANPVQAQSQQLLTQQLQSQMMSQASTPPVQSQPILTQTNIQSQPQQMMTQPTNSVQPQQLINQQSNNVQTQPQPVLPPQSMVPNQMMTQQMMAQPSMIPPTNHMSSQPNNFTVTNITQSNQQGQPQHLSNYSVSQPSSGHHYVPSSLNQQSYPNSMSMLNEVELSENKMMEQLGVQSTLVESLNDVQNATNNGDETQLEDHADSESASGTSAVAIDNKIEQAMDLVKSHLMFAVREEVEVLKEKIAELMERINQLEAENTLLKQNASQETLAQLSTPSQNQPSSNVP